MKVRRWVYPTIAPLFGASNGPWNQNYICVSTKWANMMKVYLYTVRFTDQGQIIGDEE